MNNSTLNTQHKVTLTEGQMSTILYIMEGYINPSDDYSYDPDFRAVSYTHLTLPTKA